LLGIASRDLDADFDFEPILRFEGFGLAGVDFRRWQIVENESAQLSLLWAWTGAARNVRAASEAATASAGLRNRR
jgi:hypothetical protein